MRFHLVALVSALAVSSAALFADPIPYPNVGSIAPTNVVAFAGATGTDLDAYFYNANAADTDTLSVYDLTQGTFLSPQGVLQNGSSQPGTEIMFHSPSLTTGDILVFELNNVTTGQVYASDPALSSDNENHAYMTPFSGTIPDSKVAVTGTYVGMEDEFIPGSDLDYNDETFVFTDITSSTPEPSTFLLLGTGLLSAAGLVRRKLVR